MKKKSQHAKMISLVNVIFVRPKKGSKSTEVLFMSQTANPNLFILPGGKVSEVEIGNEKLVLLRELNLKIGVCLDEDFLLDNQSEVLKGIKVSSQKYITTAHIFVVTGFIPDTFLKDKSIDSVTWLDPISKYAQDRMTRPTRRIFEFLLNQKSKN